MIPRSIVMARSASSFGSQTWLPQRIGSRSCAGQPLRLQQFVDAAPFAFDAQRQLRVDQILAVASTR